MRPETDSIPSSEKNLHLEISCNPENLKKTFDKDLMLSVVTNFIDNAVKASEENSRILLHATNDRLTVQDFRKRNPGGLIQR